MSFSKSNTINNNRTQKEKSEKRTSFLTSKEINKFISNGSYVRNKYRTLTIYDFLEKYNIVDKFEKFNELKEISNLFKCRVFIAGGSVSQAIIQENWKESDFDVFFKNFEDFDNSVKNILKMTNLYEIDRSALDLYRANPEKIWCLNFKSKVPNKKPLQLIKLAWYQFPEDVMSSFDLTCCQFVYHSYNATYKKICYNEEALDDLLNKKIIINNTMFVASLFKRIKKYMDRGFTLYDCDYKHLENDVEEIFSNNKKQEFLEKSCKNYVVNTLWDIEEFRRDYDNMELRKLNKKWNDFKK